LRASTHRSTRPTPHPPRGGAGAGSCDLVAYRDRDRTHLRWAARGIAEMRIAGLRRDSRSPGVRWAAQALLLVCAPGGGAQVAQVARFEEATVSAPQAKFRNNSPELFQPQLGALAYLTKLDGPEQPDSGHSGSPTGPALRRAVPVRRPRHRRRFCPTPAVTIPTMVHLVAVNIRVEGRGVGIGPYPGGHAPGPAGRCC
jgi:hypothetical protein